MEFLVEYFGGSTFTMEDADFLARDAAYDAWGGGVAPRRPLDVIDGSVDDGNGCGTVGGGSDDVGLVGVVGGNGRSCHHDDDDADDGDYIGE